MHYSEFERLSEGRRWAVWESLVEQDLKDERRELLLGAIHGTTHVSAWFGGLDAVVNDVNGLEHVEQFLEYANASAKDNSKRIFAKAIVENLRTKTASRDGGRTFKINNNLTADVAWLWILMFPETFGRRFEIRKACRRSMLKQMLEVRKVAA